MLDWVSVKSDLPKVPDGLYTVNVLIVTYDAMYAEYCKDPQKALHVGDAMYNPDRGFEQLVHGPDGAEWTSDYMDEVLFWMYMPKPPMVTFGDIT